MTTTTKFRCRRRPVHRLAIVCPILLIQQSVVALMPLDGSGMMTRRKRFSPSLGVEMTRYERRSTLSMMVSTGVNKKSNKSGSLGESPADHQSTDPTTTGMSSPSSSDDKVKAIEQEPCNVVFTHTNADFDTLAAAVALSLLWSKHEKPDLPTHVVLPRGVHPVVQRFLAFHKHLLPLRGFKTIMAEDVNAIGVVDTQSASRIGRGKTWLETARSVHVFDHHDGDETEDKSLLDAATEVVLDHVGSTTTLLVERLQEAGIKPAPHEATLFALGIRADTGALLYESTTIRDAHALVWCLENGASQVAISEFGAAKIGEDQRAILNAALRDTETEMIRGLKVSKVLVGEGDGYVAGLAQVCEELLDLTDSDVFLFGAMHQSGSGKGKGGKKGKSNKGENNINNDSAPTQWVSLIARASPRAVGVDLNIVMRAFGGGGHPKAAAAAVRCEPTIGCLADDEPSIEEEADIAANNQTASCSDPKPAIGSASEILTSAISIIESQIPEQLVASSFMLPLDKLITISTDDTVAFAWELFDQHRLKSAPVVDSMTHRFRGSLKLNDIIKAMRSGRSDEKLRGMMRSVVTTVLPETPLADLEEILVNKGVGRLPVVDDEGILVGMVTRTDVLRQHKLYDEEDLLDIQK